LGLTRQYVGRVLRGEKPMADALIDRLRAHTTRDAQQPFNDNSARF